MRIDSNSGTFTILRYLPFKNVLFPNTRLFSARQSTLSINQSTTEQIEDIARGTRVLANLKRLQTRKIFSTYTHGSTAQNHLGTGCEDLLSDGHSLQTAHGPIQFEGADTLAVIVFNHELLQIGTLYP